MGYGYRNAGLDVTFDRANVSDVVDAASGTLAHGSLPPAITNAVSTGIRQGAQPLVMLGWAAVILAGVVLLQGKRVV